MPGVPLLEASVYLRLKLFFYEVPLTPMECFHWFFVMNESSLDYKKGSLWHLEKNKLFFKNYLLKGSLGYQK